MNNKIRHILLLILDTILINLAVYVMLLLRFDASIPDNFLKAFIKLIPLFAIVTVSFLSGLKLYKRVWEYASIGELTSIVQATIYSMAVIVMIIYVFDLPKLPRSVYIGSWVLMNVFIGASRVWWRLFRGFIFNGPPDASRRVLVIGAGDAGAILVKEIQHNPTLKMKVIGIIDDDKDKQGLMLHGVSILGTTKDIVRLCTQMEIEEIIIAIPSASGELIRELVEICRSTTARLKILPGIYEGTQDLARNIREVRMEDLLRRKPLDIDLNEISGYITGKSVLITGGGGSIGAELTRQLAGICPNRLIVVDCCENNLFEIELEIGQDYPGVTFFSELVDIRNEERLERVFKQHRPQVVFHAAAYKHVPMMEKNAVEAWENNVIGTFNVSRLSKVYEAETFINISTDKAVNPANVMGTSKRIGELLVKEMGLEGNTRFASVRFGNVLGSRGSVVPIILQQIKKGGPVTVTHPDMRRYFMTIPEAVQLVIQAGALTQGGEIFVLDMGDMIRIDDLARDLIRLSGHQPGQDIKIVYSGIRPGERLYEELFSSPEETTTTKHKRIFVSKKASDYQSSGILERLQQLAAYHPADSQVAVKCLESLLPDYHYVPWNLENEIVQSSKLKDIIPLNDQDVGRAMRATM